MALLDDHAAAIRQACDELTNVVREGGDEIAQELTDALDELTSARDAGRAALRGEQGPGWAALSEALDALDSIEQAIDSAVRAVDANLR